MHTAQSCGEEEEGAEGGGGGGGGGNSKVKGEGEVMLGGQQNNLKNSEHEIFYEGVTQVERIKELR